MIELNLFDTNFPDQLCSVATQTPRLMRYVRGAPDWNGITIVTDGSMYAPELVYTTSRIRIGWLEEPRVLHPENYERIDQQLHLFDAVMTHDAQLLARGAPFIKTIRGGSWVPLAQWGMYPKTRNVSMILSAKRTTPAHQLRHTIADAGLPIALYGPEHTPIGYDKARAFLFARFAVVIDTCDEPGWFSEHLLDALAFGCVPIFWGAPDIGDYFDPNGFLFARDAADIRRRVAQADADGPALYESLWPAVAANQALARDYAITEDWQIQHCLRPFVEAL